MNPLMLRIVKERDKVIMNPLMLRTIRERERYSYHESFDATYG